MPQGKVKWFSTEKAYGFIAQDNDNDIFVHVTGLAEGVTSLETDQVVEFEVTQGRKGNQAANVRPVTAAAAPAAEATVAEEPEAEEAAEEPEAEEAAEEPEAEEAVEEPEAEEAVEEPEVAEEARRGARERRLPRERRVSADTEERPGGAAAGPGSAGPAAAPPSCSASSGTMLVARLRRRGTMLENVHWLGHDSFRIDGSSTLYVDPWKLPAGQPPATGVLVTHDHYDHLSADDIAKVAGAGTVVVGPPAVTAAVRGLPTLTVRPGETVEVGTAMVTAVPAYNVNKFKKPGAVYHPRDEGHVGYIVEMDGLRIYHAGDTDAIPEMAGHRRRRRAAARWAAPTR